MVAYYGSTLLASVCLCNMLTLILMCLGLHGSYSIRPNPPSKPTACTIWSPILKTLRGFEPRSLDSESKVLTVTPRGRLRGT